MGRMTDENDCGSMHISVLKELIRKRNEGRAPAQKLPLRGKRADLARDSKATTRSSKPLWRVTDSLSLSSLSATPSRATSTLLVPCVSRGGIHVFWCFFHLNAHP